MKGEDQEINKETEKLGNVLSDEMAVHILNVMETTLETGQIPKEALGYTAEKIENIYGQAYHLYNTGKYQDSAQLFRLLIVLEPKEPKYMLGLAACFHMMKEYMNAVKVYNVCSILDPTNPVPQFHLSDCFVQMRERLSAMIALQVAVQRAGDNPQYQVLKDRALMTIEGLKKELEKINSAAEQ